MLATVRLSRTSAKQKQKPSIPFWVRNQIGIFDQKARQPPPFGRTKEGKIWLKLAAAMSGCGRRLLTDSVEKTCQKQFMNDVGVHNDATYFIKCWLKTRLSAQLKFTPPKKHLNFYLFKVLVCQSLSCDQREYYPIYVYATQIYSFLCIL